ncbi:ATP-binding protein [Actinomadura sp. HBU206391]|uniref:ATP-binding protein n=1 Tax=Actinomadura sp. HBU206391 TaxID=2731692 RepID=UPI001650861A|nr:ATP-binding protein [Actinomadura sp. HBU206391]MBC6459172.1 ATP-binding protein [Actinomadura sp. HBU206391]
MNLVPVPQSVAIARVFVRHQLISLRYADRIEDASQIVSELVTNAVRATASASPGALGRIRLFLGPHHGRPLLEVWDSSPEPPVPREPDFRSESGRGLNIVRSLAIDFGWYETEGGKTVWALLR